MRMCKIIIEVQIPQIHSHTNSFNETCVVVVVVVVVVVPWYKRYIPTCAAASP